jgi:hypothetical protein
MNNQRSTRELAPRFAAAMMLAALLMAAPRALAQSGGNLPPPGAYQPIPNYTGVGAGLLFRGAINDRFSGVQPISPTIVSLAFSNLPPEQDGALIFCNDCQRANPCASGGAGAWAFGAQGQWQCIAPGVAASGPNSDITSLAALGTITGAHKDGSDAIANFNVNGVQVVTAWGLPTSSFAHTTATTTASSPTVAVASASGLAVGHWITIVGAGSSTCGAIWNGSTPSPSYACASLSGGLSLSQLGTTGSSTTTYEICNTDALGGINATCGTASVSNSPVGGPSYASPVELTATYPAGAPTCMAIWRTADPVGAGGVGYIGMTCHNVFYDYGQPVIASDLLMPSSPPGGNVNEAWRAQILSISGTTLTMTTGAPNSVTGAATFTDDAGAIQAALYATETNAAGTGMNTLEIPNGVWTDATPIFTGPNAQGLRISGTGAQINAKQLSGAALIVGDSNPSNATQRVLIDGLEIAGSGATDATHAQQDGIWLYESTKTELRDVTVLNMPDVGIAGDKGGAPGAGGFWKQAHWESVEVRNAGRECVRIGQGHEADDLLIDGSPLFNNCGQQLAVAVSDIGGFSDGGVYLAVAEPNLIKAAVDGMMNSGGAQSSSSATGYCNALNIVGATGGNLVGGHYEINGCGTTGARAGQDLFFNASSDVTVTGTDFNDSASTSYVAANLGAGTDTDIQFYGTQFDGPSSGSLAAGILLGSQSGNTVVGYTTNGNAPTSPVDQYGSAQNFVMAQPSQALIAPGGVTVGTAGAEISSIDGSGNGTFPTLKLPGSSSGHATIQAPAAAGTPTLTTPTNTGVLVANSSGVAEETLSISGALGGLTSTAAATLLQTCDVVVSAGHFTTLVITTDLNGSTCTTAPTFNVRDDTASTTGTAKAGGTSAGQVSQAQTLTFAAGDRVCIVRTANGGTCTAPFFGVSAHLTYP